MITRRYALSAFGVSILAPFVPITLTAQESAARLTVLFDAFGKSSELKRGWGYSAFIEYAGRRILFDTGSKGADFAHNANALGVDLKKLDFVVLSHRHNDHTAGLNHVLRENPGVAIYTPIEVAGFNSPTPPQVMNLIKRYVASVPDELRYFGGNTPSENRSEPPWADAKFLQVRDRTEPLPGFTLVSTRSDTPGTREMNEISLVIKTPKGGVVVVGCSHPGIEKIVEAAAQIEPKIYAVFGGFHLVDISDADVTDMVTRFRDKWKPPKWRSRFLDGATHRPGTPRAASRAQPRGSGDMAKHRVGLTGRLVRRWQSRAARIALRGLARHSSGRRRDAPADRRSSPYKCGGNSINSPRCTVGQTRAVVGLMTRLRLTNQARFSKGLAYTLSRPTAAPWDSVEGFPALKLLGL